MVDEAGAEPTLDAQHADAGEVLRVVEHFDNLVIAADLELDTAAHAAVGAGGGDFPHPRPLSLRVRGADVLDLLLFEMDRPGGADG